MDQLTLFYRKSCRKTGSFSDKRLEAASQGRPPGRSDELYKLFFNSPFGQVPVATPCQLGGCATVVRDSIENRISARIHTRSPLTCSLGRVNSPLRSCTHPQPLRGNSFQPTCQ